MQIWGWKERSYFPIDILQDEPLGKCFWSYCELWSKQFATYLLYIQESIEVVLYLNEKIRLLSLTLFMAKSDYVRNGISNDRVSVIPNPNTHEYYHLPALNHRWNWWEKRFLLQSGRPTIVWHNTS
jgi:hypothetical protein